MKEGDKWFGKGIERAGGSGDDRLVLVVQEGGGEGRDGGRGK